MPHRLKIATVDAIPVPWRLGWAFRRTAPQLGVRRKMASCYVRAARPGSDSAFVSAGTGGVGRPDVGRLAACLTD